MNDPDQRGWPLGIDDDLPERLWALDEHMTPEGHPAADSAGLVSLFYIKSELRRHAMLLCVLTLLGLLVGGGLYATYPPSYSATTTVLLKAGPNQNPAVQIETDAALATSNGVAAAAVKQLGLSDPPSSLQANYTVTVLTSETILFDVTAPTGAEALARASAITSNFLKVFDRYARIGLDQTQAQLNEQVAAAQARVDSIDKEVSQATGSATPGQLTGLRAKQTAANDNLFTVQQYATNTLATTQTATAAEIQGSQVLDAATLQPHSHIKKAALYIVGGLFGGLAIGVIIVVLMALLTERLRRRDDISEALDAPLGLSVGSLRRSGLHWGKSRTRMASDRARVVEYLARSVPEQQRGPAALCVVAVDNAAEVSSATADLVRTYAARGRSVLVADLCAGAPTARALGASGPGLSPVRLDGVDGAVVVPAKDDIAPIGPRRVGDVAAADSLLAASSRADLLLTIVDLDPAIGAEHLATWASDAVAIVTAGRSTATRLRAVSGMIKLSHMRRMSVVLIDADKADESLGREDWPERLARRGPV